MSYLGLIYSYSDKENLRELTSIRAMASLPIGGKYRIIDLVLSNFVNSGIFEVSVIAKTNYHSLIDHLAAGAEWDMSRKRGGLRVLTPFSNPEAIERSYIYRGTLDALANHMHSIKHSLADYVIITGSKILYNIDFRDMINVHIQSGADITVAYTTSLNGENRMPQGVPMLKMDEKRRITQVDVIEEELNDTPGAWGIGVCVIRKTLLESLVADAISHQWYDLYLDVFKRLALKLNILGYEYKKQLLEVGTVCDYKKANMLLLDREFSKKVFEKTVYTKVKDSVPAFYGANCYVENSIISDGCDICGTVVNCVVSRGVRIEKGAVVKDSILMQDTVIISNSKVEHAILDKDVIVREGKEVIGHETYPIVVPKLSIV